MLEDPIVYEIYTTFNRDNELPYEDMIKYISDHYELTEENAKRLYKKAEDLYDELVKSNWLLNLNELLPWMKPLPKI